MTTRRSTALYDVFLRKEVKHLLFFWIAAIMLSWLASDANKDAKSATSKHEKHTKFRRHLPSGR